MTTRTKRTLLATGLGLTCASFFTYGFIAMATYRPVQVQVPVPALVQTVAAPVLPTLVPCTPAPEAPKPTVVAAPKPTAAPAPKPYRVESIKGSKREIETVER